MYIMDNQPLNTGEQKDMTEFFTDLITKIEEMSPELVSTSPCWLLTCGMCPLPSQLRDASVMQILINTCMVQFLILAGVSQSIVNAFCNAHPDNKKKNGHLESAYPAAQSTEQAYAHNVHQDGKCYQKNTKNILTRCHT